MPAGTDGGDMSRSTGQPTRAVRPGAKWGQRLKACRSTSAGSRRPDGDGCPDERIVQTDSNEQVAEALTSGEANLTAGTA